MFYNFLYRLRNLVTDDNRVDEVFRQRKRYLSVHNGCNIEKLLAKASSVVSCVASWRGIFLGRISGITITIHPLERHSGHILTPVLPVALRRWNYAQLHRHQSRKSYQSQVRSRALAPAAWTA